MKESPLKTLLLETMGKSGPMNFERYMEYCLYHPELGYYMQGRERTGIHGDFFTSADLHPIFARLVARQAAEMWEILGRPPGFSWVEMGAGRGVFATDFLRWTKTALPEFHEALDYVVVEPGPRQRARVLHRIAGEGDGLRLRALASLEDLNPLAGCFFSNELVDAFPVSIVTRARGRLKEIYVEAHGDQLRETLGPISDSAVAGSVAKYASQLDEGHRVEVNRRATQWLRSLAEKLRQGFIMTIDYGALAENLYTPARPRGTLMAYRGHRAAEDYYAEPGEQDLTSHVNFSALIDGGKEVGLKLEGLTTQERFLMALGEANQFADLYDPGQTEDEKVQARLKLKRLIYPGGPEEAPGMGSIFKVLIQSRGTPSAPLTGLKFG